MKNENGIKVPNQNSREEGIKAPLPAGPMPETSGPQTENTSGKENHNDGDFPVATVDSCAATGDLPPRLPKESEVMYQRFLWFYHNGRGMSLRQLAAQFGIPASGVCYVKRTYAWDARAQEHALHRDRSPEPAEWEERRQELRKREWFLHLELIQAGQEGLRRWRESDKVPSIGEIVRLLELASRLGRLASGMPLDHTEISGNETNPIRVEFEMAVQKIYGQESSSATETSPGSEFTPETN